MKKLLAIILCLAMVFTLAACGGDAEAPAGGEAPAGTNDGGENQPSGGTNNGGTNDGGNQPSGGSSSSGLSVSAVSGSGYASEVFAADMVYAKSGGVSALNDLSNTYYKLTKEKKLKIGYIGGSVTDGTGGTNGYCWAKGVTDWFKEKYPDAEITDTNNGWGNKSSLWGFYRADGDNDWGRSSHDMTLITAKPDLIFLEFAINDLYVRMSDFTTIHYVEGLINKIRKALPETDIVLILITDESYIGKEDFKPAAAQRKLAEFYGIPVIDVGAAMNEYIKSTGIAFDKLYTDTVHPNNDGYKVYADAITKHLEGVFSKCNATAVKPCEMPKTYYVSGGISESKIYTATDLKEFCDISDWTVLNSPSNQVNCFGPSLYGLDGAKLSFDMEGTGLCLMVDAKQGSVVKCVIDGKESVAVSVLNNIHAEMLVVNNLAPGKHKIELTVASGQRFIIGAVMIER